MPEEDESGVQVVDKRRVGRPEGAETRGSGANATASQAPPTEPEEAAVASGSAEGKSPEPDARGANDGGQPAAAEREPGAGEEWQPGAPEDEEEGEALPTSVVDLAQMCLGMMNEVAWVKMGLVPDPMT